MLHAVGNLIRTYGGPGWEEEVPQILKKDMKSLTSGEGMDDGETQSLNLQQRVIQSGLDSLEGEDAADIVILFKVYTCTVLCYYCSCNFAYTYEFQGYGGICGGPDRSSDYLERAVGEY